MTTSRIGSILVRFPKRPFVLLLTVALLAVTSAARADTVVYATASNNLSGNSVFGTLDLTTGRFAQTATLGISVDALTAGPNGTLLATAGNGNLYTLTPATGAAARFGSVSGLGNAFGLAAVPNSTSFYEVDSGSNTTPTYTISADGNTRTAVGNLHDAGNNAVLTGGTGIVAAANGTLYANGFVSSGAQTLYAVNPTTGLATAVGSGLGEANGDALTLGSAGATLYGIDTTPYYNGSGPAIYTINASTGRAIATGVTVSGLSNGFTLDAFAVPTPLPKAATAGLSLLGLLGVTKRVRRRRPVTA